MKKIRLSVLGLGALVVFVSSLACNPSAQAPEVKLETDEQQALYALGLIMAQRLELFGMSEAELATFEAGLRDGVLARPKKLEPQSVDAKIQALATERQQAMGAKEKAEGTAFLEQRAAVAGATRDTAGFVLRALREGEGASPAASDTVSVHYHGTLRDGTVFDSSVDRGQPAEFPLSGVIPCWTQAVQKMKLGGKYELTCPPELAYGDGGRPPSIKPSATLSFEVELLEIKAAQAAPAPPVPPAGKKPKK